MTAVECWLQNTCTQSEPELNPFTIAATSSIQKGMVLSPSVGVCEHAHPTMVPTPTSLPTATPATEVNSSGADEPAAIKVAPATSSDRSSFSEMASKEGTKKSSHMRASPGLGHGVRERERGRGGEGGAGARSMGVPCTWDGWHQPGVLRGQL